MKLFGELRQLLYPEEFRITNSKSDIDITKFEETLNELMEIIASIGITPPPTVEDYGFLADVTTGLWRLKSKMTDSKTGGVLDEMRKPFRHLESVWDALTQAELEIIDHTNEVYIEGMSVKVLSFEESNGIKRETIIETVKPTVYFKNNRIQIGTVVVGTPKN